jgi:hypothetical protein
VAIFSNFPALRKRAAARECARGAADAGSEAGAVLICGQIIDPVHSADPDRRFLFWATFLGGDPDQPVRVAFDLEGHGHGFYLRYEGDQPVNLLRYDRGAGSSTPWYTAWPRGAVLRAASPPFGGGWRPSELPDRNVLLGSDYGEPVSRAEAREIAELLGYEPWILDEPTVSNQ